MSHAMRPDSCGLETFRLIFLNQTKKRTSKRSFYSWKPLDTESLAEVQFVSDGCRLVSQIILEILTRIVIGSFYSALSEKRCTLTPLFLIWKIKFGLKILAECAGKLMDSLSWTNKEASTVLCSVVKHLGSGRARKKCMGKHETWSSVSSTSWVLYPFLSALQQNRAQSGSFICFMIKNPFITPHI